MQESDAKAAAEKLTQTAFRAHRSITEVGYEPYTEAPGWRITVTSSKPEAVEHKLPKEMDGIPVHVLQGEIGRPLAKK